jgi:hypothetical protein
LPKWLDKKLQKKRHKRQPLKNQKNSIAIYWEVQAKEIRKSPEIKVIQMATQMLML